jgi:hypothetical protein
LPDAQPSFLAAGLLAGLSIGGATLLLIIPGIIVATGLALTFVVVVDRNLDALAALNASWAATRGNRLHLFGLIVIACVVSWLVSTIPGATAAAAGLVNRKDAAVLARPGYRLLARRAASERTERAASAPDGPEIKSSRSGRSSALESRRLRS